MGEKDRDVWTEKICGMELPLYITAVFRFSTFTLSVKGPLCVCHIEPLIVGLVESGGTLM